MFSQTMRFAYDGVFAFIKVLLGYLYILVVIVNFNDYIVKSVTQSCAN